MTALLSEYRINPYVGEYKIRLYNVMSGTWFTRQVRLIVIFVGAVMLPTILLGFLAIRTAETEKLLVWEKLKESYTSLANVVSDQLDNMLSSAENDFWDSVSALTSHDKNSLQQLSHRLESEHKLIGQVFFLDASGEMIFPEDPRRERRDDVGTRRAMPGQEERDIFESYLAAAERQEFKHNNPQRAVYEYQRILNDLREPVYRAIALNGIARCYAKLELNQEAVDHYNEVIDKYIDVTDGWIDIAAMAYLRAASIYKKMGDVDAAVEMLMDLYSNLSDNRWDLDAEEIWYFADRTRRQLLAYRDSGDIRFSPFAVRFAEIDAKVIRLVKLRRFLKNYKHLISDEMTKAVNRDSSEFMLHVLRYTDAGPYLVSYIPNPERGHPARISAVRAGFKPALTEGESSDTTSFASLEDDIALAGFEVNLGYLALQGFKEVLSGLAIKDDVILAILNQDDEIVEARGSVPLLGTKHPKGPLNPPSPPLIKGGDRTPLPPLAKDRTPFPPLAKDRTSFPPLLKGGEGGFSKGELIPGKPITTVMCSSLPFWKVGVYLKEPRSLEKLSKRKATLRISVIVGLVLAIAFGIYLALREAKREAELVRLRSDFVANVSHELRTPLSSIQIFSETLKQNRITSRDKQEQYLDTIASESDRLARLVDNVLNFSRLERRTKEFNFQPINVDEVVTSAVEAYRFYAEQRGVTIRLNMAQNLPQIQADSEAISQMVTNLLDNAVKYSEDENEITINVFRRGNKIVIQVADRGVGIDEEDVKKIFDKFYRGKNVANLGTGGTGLGLTLAKAVAEAHGGDIRVRSKRGVGSRFSVVLPVISDE